MSTKEGGHAAQTISVGRPEGPAIRREEQSENSQNSRFIRVGVRIAKGDTGALRWPLGLGGPGRFAKGGSGQEPVTRANRKPE